MTGENDNQSSENTQAHRTYHTNELVSCDCSIAIVLPKQPLLRYNRDPQTTNNIVLVIDLKSTAPDPHRYLQSFNQN